ncbi:hypothetical protein ACFY4C_20340 [Actinomadura viridis]|uniref:hypothetical protein n=1 Tax=Actinomadura viridis TaxID=58110 RepID=UPI0036C72F24
MALLSRTRPRRGGRHAARTPLWHQLGFARREECLPAPRLMTPDTAPAATTAPDLPVPVADARVVVGMMFDPDRLDPSHRARLPRLDWQYTDHAASAQVDPDLGTDTARGVVEEYAARMRAAVVEDQAGDRTLVRTSCVFYGIQVTVWATFEPEPTVEPEVQPEPEPQPVRERQPLEREALGCLATQEYAPLTDDGDEAEQVDDGAREHPDAASTSSTSAEDDEEDAA